MESNHEPTPSLGPIKRFLAWPSGATPSVLAQCPSELNYYCGLGTLVWFTSFLAGCGMALMLEQTGGSFWKALAGGVFWFLCVLNLDRFLLLVGYDSNGWKKLMPVARILLSLCIAIIIGEHVVQYIFHNEIDYQLAQEGLDAKKSNYDKALQGSPEIIALYDEQKRKQTELDRKEVEVTKLRDDYIKEAEGTAGSRIVGKGPLYEQKQRDYEVALADKQKLKGELEEIDSRLREMNAQLTGVVELANGAKARERGFLAYHRALFEIIKKNPTLLVLYLVISCAMILFEITPLLSKLSGKGKLHDHLAEKELELRKGEADERHETQLQSFKSENQSKKKLAEKIFQLQLDTLDEITNAIRSNTHSTLTKGKSDLAQSILDHVHKNIVQQVRPKGVDAEADYAAPDANFDPNNLSSVTVTIKGDESDESFTIVFGGQRNQVRGDDLVYALAGLERQRPSTTQPRVPLHECKATNAQGEAIDLDGLLFPQISGNANVVYLSPFEPTVSTAEN